MVIKYTFLTVKNLIKSEPVIFALIMANIICSAIMLIFSVGFYRHIEQKKIDRDYGEKYFWVDFYDSTKPYIERKALVESEVVCKGELLKLLCEMDEKALKKCNCITIDVKFPEDVLADSAVDEILSTEAEFVIQNNEIQIAKIEKNLSENGALIEGRYFTPEEVSEAVNVCLEPEYDLDHNLSIVESEEGYRAAQKYKKTENGTYWIRGKEYQCIGRTIWFSIIPIVPVTTIDDESFVTRIIFEYENYVSRESYEEIIRTLQTRYGGIMQTSPIDIQEVNTDKYNNFLMVICIMIATLSGTVTTFIFQFIWLREKHVFCIYHLCGMKREKINFIIFSIFIMLSVNAYFVGTLLYQFVIMPYMSSYFEYLSLSCNVRNYLFLGGVYLTFSFITYCLLSKEKFLVCGIY